MLKGSPEQGEGDIDVIVQTAFIAVCSLMLVSFVGSFLISVESSRDQQVGQLRAHAQDTATALGLSLGPYARDQAMLELMVSSVFDSGYFESIRLIEPETGTVLVERSGAPVARTAPDWFARLIDLEPARGTPFSVTAGVRRAG